MINPMDPTAIRIGYAAGIRVVSVEDDTMEPTLRRGDAVLAAPAETYSGEGVYLIDKGYPAVYRVSPHPNGKLSLYRDNKAYGGPEEWSREDFGRFVIGKVGALVKVINSTALGLDSR